MSIRHLLSADDLSKSDILSLLKQATAFYEGLQKDNSCFCDFAKNHIMASLFFESSTRTRFSFESAMYRLGGEVLTLESGGSSSIKKGETLSDTGRIMSEYADIVVMRHPQPGSVKELASHASIPVINAGDGPNQHPSQSLLDLFTIQHFFGKLEGLSIGMVGDLKFGRTIHSLILLLSAFPNQTFYLVSHSSLKLDRTYILALREAGHTVVESEGLQEVISKLDVLYMTRTQEERFESKEAYEKVKDLYILTKESLKGSQSHLKILHPLPRIQEIHTEVDMHPAAVYFTQAKFGVCVRMALLSHLLNLH